MPPAPQPVTVVLPLLGDPVPLLSSASELVERWPVQVEGRLVVAAPVLGARDRGLLAQLGADVRLVEVPGNPVFGELAVAAAAGAAEGTLLVLDHTALPTAADLLQLASGGAVPGGVLLPAHRLSGAPVLTAAHSLPALAALLEALGPEPDPECEPAAPLLSALPDDGTGRTGLLSVVVAVTGPVDRTRAALASLRRGTRVRLEVLVVDASAPLSTRTWLSTQRDLSVVPTTGRGPVADVGAALAASSGESVVLLDEQALLPRFWAEGLLRVLDEEGVVAVGPRAGFLPAEQAAPADADADAWRRKHAGTSAPASRLDGACLAVRRVTLQQTGLLDEALSTLQVALVDLVLRLRRHGELRVADDVLLQRASDRPLVPTALDDDLRHVQAVHGTALGRDVWLSAALIVKDEQSALPACLAALRGVVDEVVVCDTGSSDRTVEIAEAFGARTLSAPWTGDFAAARNAVLDACRGVWVLSVDADEQLRLVPGADLRRQLLALDGDADAATLVIRSRSEEEGVASFEHAAGRLFRRGAVRWVGAVHENLAGVRTGLPPTYVSVAGAWLDHDGYLGRVYEARDKGSRNLLLAEKDHAQALAEGQTARLWKTSYELARALSKDKGNEHRVEDLMREALRRMPDNVGHLRCDAHVRLATALAHQRRLDDAERAAKDALGVRPGDPAALLVLGEVLAAAGRHADALAALDTPSADGGAVRDLGKQEVDLPLLRARLLHALGRGAEAAEVLLSLADRGPDALDWPLLHEVLRDVPGGTATLAALVAATPEPALAALDGLGDDERGPLFAAVRACGIDPDAHTPGALHARRLDQVLQGHDARTVEQAALALEDSDPEAALDLWARVPDSATVRVATARCLLQLGRTEQALNAVDGLDVGALDLGDLLVVVALAAAAGDRETAQMLLDSVDEVPDPLRSTVDGLAESLGLVV